MTLIAHSQLPTFERLRQEGQEILSIADANEQHIRELHVGLYNMMPDAALEATERQFLRLIGSSNRIVQFYVHLFAPSMINRKGKAKEHVEKYYESFEDFKDVGLDALIITGANPLQDNLSEEPFWPEFCELIKWAHDSVTSVLCSCLATHAVFELLYEEKRIKLPKKCWGVYSHNLITKDHPLVINTNTRFDAPHSHIYTITREQAEKHDVLALATSETAGLHMAVSRDFRFVFFQGHPEYDVLSLLKEYKREVVRFFNELRPDYPEFPDNYFAEETFDMLSKYKDELLQAKNNMLSMTEFPEKRLVEYLNNTWVDTSKSTFNNWLGIVYKITHSERSIRLMTGLDDANPLGY